MQYPKYAKHLIRIDNGGKKSVQAHVLAKALGEVKGASDLFLAVPRGQYAGFWIEVKPDNHKITKSNEGHCERQLRFIGQMKSVGYHGQIVIGVQQAINSIKRYMDAKNCM